MTESLVFVGVSPHPPIIVPAIGGSRLPEVSQTIAGVRNVMRRLVASRPDCAVLVSPHVPADPRAFVFYSGPRLRGDFGQFDAPNVRCDFGCDQMVLSRTVRLADDSKIPVRLIHAGRPLDHGAMVPLYFLMEAGYQGKIVVMGPSALACEMNLSMGRTLRRTAQELTIRLAIVASGDMSHRLRPGAPAGYDPDAHLYDEAIVKGIAENQAESIVQIDPELRQAAAEDIYSSLLIALGALEGKLVHSEVCSYEGPFGVGYLSAVLHDQEATDASCRTALQSPTTPQSSNPASPEAAAETSTGVRQCASVRFARVVGLWRGLLQSPTTPQPSNPDAAEASVTTLPALARSAVSTFLKTGQIIRHDGFSFPGLQDPAGVFVCLTGSQGDLRGCVGTTYPAYPSISEEIVWNAIAAATRDDRFSPVGLEELDLLRFTVHILSPLQVADGPEHLDARLFGVVVEGSRGERGTLLPDLPAIQTIEEQLKQARVKAGIDESEPIKIWRFSVERFGEETGHSPESLNV